MQMTYSQELRELFQLDTVSYHYNLDKKALFEAAIAGDRGRVKVGGPADAQKAFATKLGNKGPLVYYTDPGATGRRVQDTYCAAYPEFEDQIWWKADFQKYNPEKYEALLKRVVAHLNAKKASLHVQDVFAGSDSDYALPFRFVGEFATHALFVQTMFPKQVKGANMSRRFTLLNVPSFVCDPARDGCRSEATLIVDLRRMIALIAGPMDYCGSNKKTLFTVLNFVLPQMGYLPMHCSANVGEGGDSAILFGLSGTGKTTLSADPHRKLIGDDEIGWTDNAVSNFEDGCYAKLIDLDKQAEPVIAAALSMPYTIIENVPPLPGKALADTDPQELDLSDKSITENTRFAYGLDCNPIVQEGSKGPVPKTIVLLTADAFGVLPPVSLLSQEEVMYHFASGFTAKLAGTEVGVTEPKAAFSACFGAPFMPRHPSVYAELLAKKMKSANARAILLNTGWSGGGYGVGKRMSLKYTRALLNAALRGDLDHVQTEVHPIFNLRMPKTCPDVPAEILNPRNTWTDKAAYDAAATKLRDMFRKNYDDKQFGKLGIKAVM
ncbi:MAG TPA: phosphoenolpyruvate carboxykinase (ATP) [Planctomycetota bacterium]|nr:phosphoenolpyruvate carboxykinase (ATP) [Planctomycetota bacterium]